MVNNRKCSIENSQRLTFVSQSRTNFVQITLQLLSQEDHLIETSFYKNSRPLVQKIKIKWQF